MNTDTDTTTIDLDPEQAVIEQAKAEDVAAAEATKAEAAKVEDTPVVVEPVVEAKPDPIAQAIAESAAATRALAEQVAAQNKPAEAPAVVEKPRDFAAEAAALKQSYEDGDLTQDDYDAKRDELTEARLEAKLEAKLAAAREADAAERAKQSEQQAEQAWQAAQTKFFADPGNAALVSDPIKQAGFGAAVQVAFNEFGNTKSFDELLAIAREKLTGVPAIDPAKAIKDAEGKRLVENRTTPVETLRDTPSAGNNDNAPGASLDHLGISELEDALFRMSDADRARYLADAPGGLRDNPRATS